MKNRSSLVLVLVLALWCIVASPAVAQNAYDLFQKAATAERAQGDLETAIELYQQVVEAPTAERALAAKALFQIGVCYERLGHDKAEEAYSRVAVEFVDQTEIAALARARLAALAEPARGAERAELAIRRVWVVPPEMNIRRRRVCRRPLRATRR